MYINNLGREPVRATHNTFLSRPQNLNAGIARPSGLEERKIHMSFKGEGHVVDLAFWFTGNPDIGSVTSANIGRPLGDLLKSVSFGSLRSSALWVRENNDGYRKLFMEVSNIPADAGSSCFNFSIWPETNAAIPVIMGSIEFFRS